MKDWEGMLFPKNARIKDNKAINSKQHICEYCEKRGWTNTHHITSKGSGGDDTADNLIELCSDCHIRVHSGEISKKDLRKIVERRRLL